MLGKHYRLSSFPARCYSLKYERELSGVHQDICTQTQLVGHATVGEPGNRNWGFIKIAETPHLMPPPLLSTRDRDEEALF